MIRDRHTVEGRIAEREIGDRERTMVTMPWLLLPLGLGKILLCLLLRILGILALSVGGFVIMQVAAKLSHCNDDCQRTQAGNNEDAVHDLTLQVRLRLLCERARHLDAIIALPVRHHALSAACGFGRVVDLSH